MRNVLIALLTAVCLVGFTLRGEPQSPPPELPPAHPLIGAWLATDGTVFVFRKDGTFHGFDFRHKEIWGNWVTLSPTRIGFQSLLHDSFYRPQYAIIDKAGPDSMDYVVTGGKSFIKAARLPLAKAEAAIEVVVEPQICHPQDTSAADKAHGE